MSLPRRKAFPGAKKTLRKRHRCRSREGRGFFRTTRFRPAHYQWFVGSRRMPLKDSSVPEVRTLMTGLMFMPLGGQHGAGARIGG